MDFDDLDELLALGAAGALRADEQAELERMLAADADAAARFATLQAGAATLAEAVAEDPPAHLRAAVLAAVAARGPGGPAAHEVGRVVPLHRRRWMIPATSIAAAVVLLAGAFIVTREAGAPGDGDMMAAVLEDDAALTAALHGAAGELQIVASMDHGATVLMGEDVMIPDDRHVLQLWAIEDGEPVGMGTFRPTGAGQVSLLIEAVAPPGSAYAVTVEPMGGSEQPTGDPVAVSEA